MRKPPADPRRRDVLLLGPYAPPAGGVASFVEGLHYWLGRLGCRITVAAYRGYRPVLAADEVRPGFTVLYRFFRRLPQRVIAVDSCSFFIEYPHAGSLLAWLWAHWRKRWCWVKVIHDGTLPQRYAGFGRWQRLVADMALRRVDCFLATSPDLSLWLRSRSVAAPIHEITSLLPIRKSVPQVTARFLSFDSTVPVDGWACSVGAFTHHYGFSEIAEAVERVRASVRPIGLVLMVTQFSEDAGYAERVLADRPWIVVLRDISRRETLELLANALVLVRLPSVESFGLCRAEALLAGTPVIGTPTGFVDGVECVGRDDAERLYLLLSRIAADPGLRVAKVTRRRVRRRAFDNLRNVSRILCQATGGAD